MGIWSSIREFYRRWKAEIDLYGIGFLLFSSALVVENYKAAWVILFIVLVMDAMRRWGEPYRQMGKREMELRRQASKARWEARFGNLFSRFHKDPDEPARTSPPPATYVIPRPRPDGEEPPESPAQIVETAKPAPPVPPPVTHDT